MTEHGPAPGGRRRQILDLLRGAGAPLSIQDVAGRLDTHPNTARFHLEALAETGEVERHRPAHRTIGRPPALYSAARRMSPAGPRSFRMLAEILTDSVGRTPDGIGRAVEASHRFGRRLAERAPSEGATKGAAVERLADLLDELGFAPERRDTEDAIALRHCPFLEVAEQSTQVVCPVHLGLMRGALEAWEAPVTATDLVPFAEPDLCLTHLAPVRRAGS